MSGRLTMGRHQPSASRGQRNAPHNSIFPSRDLSFPRGDLAQTLIDIFAISFIALFVLLAGLAILLLPVLVFFF